MSDLEPFGVNVDDAARMTSLSPHTIRAYIRRKILPVSRAGRRVVVPVESLRTLVREGVPSLGTKNKEKTVLM
jgi:hypothetical protein